MIKVERLTKRYGREAVVDDLSFELKRGMVTGFVGPNGAGKTTTMAMMLGLVAPSSGVALVDGRPYGAWPSPLRKVGAAVGPPGAHPAQRTRDHLVGLALSNGIGRHRVDDVLQSVGLSDAARKRVGQLSLGMGQRLAIAAALLGEPEVLLFDEPFTGLDIDGIRWLRQLLRRLAEEGRTVLFSNHHMAEMELVADRLIVIGQGRLLADASVADLLATEVGVGATSSPARSGPSLEDVFVELTRDSITHQTEGVLR